MPQARLNHVTAHVTLLFPALVGAAALLCGVAHAETPAVQMSASPEDGVRLDVPGVLMVQPGMLVQLAGEARGTSRTELGAHGVVRMARPHLRLKVPAMHLGAFAQAELAGGNARLLDLRMDWSPLEAFTLGVGQFIPPFSRAFMTPVPQLMFPDFSSAELRFRDDRDVGAVVEGAALSRRVQWHLAVLEGPGLTGVRRVDVPTLLVGRVSVQPLGAMDLTETPGLVAPPPTRVSLGLNTSVRTADVKLAGTTALLPSQRTGATVGADLAAWTGPVSLMAEAYAHQDLARAPALSADTTADRWWQTLPRRAQGVSLGAYGQAGLMVLPRRLEVATRLSLLQDNVAGPGVVGPAAQADALVTGYILRNRLKVQTRSALIHPATPAGRRADPGYLFSVNLQVLL